MSKLDHKEFLRSIERQHLSGYGLVPFIGSGLSSASGMLTAEEFDLYMRHVLWRSCGSTPSHIWKLREQGWPAYPTASEIKKGRKWMGKILADLHDPGSGLLERLPVGGQSRDWWRSRIKEMVGGGDDAALKSHVLQLVDHAAAMSGDRPRWLTPPETVGCGVLSLASWTEALSFLASLSYDHDAERNIRERVSQSVIDAFNTHITKGRRRNLAHSMLCHLANRMGIRLILTTNFDNLIEEAFTEMREPLRVMPVSNTGRLPSPHSVHRVNCCVKLHGELHETRADFSVNEIPSDDDLNSFYSYVTGKGRSAHGKAQHRVQSFRPSHLLVCGYSGSDERCMRMIEHTLDCSEKTKVFWICHTRNGQEKIENLPRFREFNRRGQIYTTVTERTDLLLYELYQQIGLSLPRGGFNYQFNHNSPPRHWLDASAAEIGTTRTPPDIKADLDKGKILLVRSESSVMRQMEGIFEAALALRKESIWLELEDYEDACALAQEVFQVISLRKGNYDLEQTSFLPELPFEGESASEELQDRFKDVLSSWRVTASDYVIMIYGRNGPGGCVGWQRSEVSDGYWSEGNLEKFHLLLKVFLKCGFHVIYAPYDQGRKDADEQTRSAYEKMVKQLNKKTCDLVSLPFPNICVDSYVPKNVEGTDFGDIALPPRKSATSSWIQRIANLKMRLDGLPQRDQEREAHFYLAMSLFRQSRHFSALISEAMISCPRAYNTHCIDNDFKRKKVANEYLGGIRDLTREKRGGYTWLYRDTRLVIREVARGSLQVRCELDEEMLIVKEALIHSKIGGWYARAFCATSHVKPLKECLHHFFQAALHELQSNSRGGEHSLIMARRHLYTVVKYLRLGRMTIRFWTDPSDARTWLDFSNEGRPNSDLVELNRIWNEKLKVLARDHGVDVDPWGKQIMDLTTMITVEGRRHLAPCFFLPDHFRAPCELDPPLSSVSSEDFLEACQKASSTSYAADFGDFKAAWIGNLGKHFPGVGDSISGLLESVFSGQECDKEVMKNRMLRIAADSGAVDIALFAQAGFEMCYSLLRRAKAEERLLLGTDWKSRCGPERLNSKWRDSIAAKRWVAICRLSKILLGMCEHIHPNHADIDFTVRTMLFRTYSLALARLGRFYESHRRLNESHALLTKLARSHTTQDMAIIKLRRAEAHLLEAELLFEFRGKLENPKGDMPAETVCHLRSRYLPPDRASELDSDSKTIARYCASKIDDASISLEQAQQFLSGQSHSSLWWGRLSAIELRVHAFISNLPVDWEYRQLAHRDTTDTESIVERILVKGMNSSVGRPYASLRLLHYYKVWENGWKGEVGRSLEKTVEYWEGKLKKIYSSQDDPSFQDLEYEYARLILNIQTQSFQTHEVADQ